jgi:DNA-binding transcriptional MerR regulator
MAAKQTEQARYSISEAARLLDRSPQTLRSWDRNESMPKKLRPKRDDQGNRYWTPELIEEIKAWIIKNNFHPGRGISYAPTPERLQQHIDRIRRSSKKTTDEPAPLAELRELIATAPVPQDQVAAQLPQVAAQMGIPLADALRVAGEVFAA